MIIVTAVFLVFLLLSLRKSTSVFSNNISQEAFSLKNTNAVRGILAISIVLCHLTARVERELPFVSMSIMASVGVGLFFIFSGYSLIVSLKAKPNYMSGFLKKRFINLGIPYLILILIYIFVRCVFFDVPFKEILTRTVKGDLISNSWYMVAILVFSVVFWLVFRKNGFDTKNPVIKICIGIVIYIFCCVIFGWPEWWIVTCEMFVVGICFAYTKEHVEKILKNNYWLFAGIAFIFSMGAYLFPAIFNRITNVSFSFVRGMFTFDIWLINSVFMGFFIPIFLCILMYKFNVINRTTSFLGKISLEIYLFHGLIIECLIDLGLPKISEELFTVSVLIITIIVAILFNKLSSYIIKTKSVQRFIYGNV